MNSSVTLASAISVMSSLCLEISPSSRSNGPAKTSRCTSNGVLPPRRVITPPGVSSTRGGAELGRVGLGHGASGRAAAGDELAGQLPVGLGAAWVEA